MMKITWIHILVIVTLLQGGAVHGQDLQQSVANRLPSVEKLLNESSGALQVIDSTSAEARQKRREALEMLAQARERYRAGDFVAANDLLNRSSQRMFVAIKLVAPTSIAVDHARTTYSQRKDSVLALRDAFNRILGETGDEESGVRVNLQLERFLDAAEQRRESGDNSGARGEIEKAYHLLKLSIESVRSGQTLVRSLNFADKREEYVYEIDRNDTHNMLIGLLVDTRNKSESAQKQIIELVAEADTLRRQAEVYADEAAYQQAIDLLEQSTRQLVRAIRSAGIYIPG